MATESSFTSTLKSLLLVFFALAINYSCASPDDWNVVLVTFDTTRADYLGCYGKKGAHTPNLDKLAAGGFLFENCTSAAPMTMPSHSTIMTGTYPMAHGVRENGLYVLPQGRTTLAEILKSRGYQTAAAIGSFVLDSQFGLSQGFDLYEDRVKAPSAGRRSHPGEVKRGIFFDERPSSSVNQSIMPWLEENIHSPFFVWLHYWDPHHPHIPPSPYDQIYAHDLYQGEIAFADESLGKMIDLLNERGVAQRTIFVMTSDHGEGIGQHGESTHSMLCYNSTLHVPLLIKIPGAAGGVKIDQRVGTVDILPTILDLLEIPRPPEIAGRSLRSQIENSIAREKQPSPYYAETLSPRLSWGWGELRVWFDGEFKYIHGPRPELFNVKRDPQELDNLFIDQPQRAASMKAQLAEFLARYADSTAAEAASQIDEATLQRLAALGYISTDSAGTSQVHEILRDDGIAPDERVGDINDVSAAKSLLVNNQYLPARETCLRLVEKDPDNPYYQYLLAMSYLGLGQLQNAADAIALIGNPSSRYAKLYYQIGDLLAAAGRAEDGLVLVESVVDADQSSEGFWNQAQILKKLNRTNEYLDALERSLAVDETFTPARLELAVYFAESLLFDLADDNFRKVMANDPLNPLGHFNYGLFLTELDRTAESLRYFDRAIQLDRNYWPAYLASISVNLALQNRPAAMQYYRDLQDRCRQAGVLQQARQIIESP